MRRRLALLGLAVLTALTVSAAGTNATANTAGDATFSSSPVGLFSYDYLCC